MANPISSTLQYLRGIQSPISSYETTTDGYLKASLYGIPIFTYTLIAITTVTLAFVTLTDGSSSSSSSSSSSASSSASASASSYSPQQSSPQSSNYYGSNNGYRGGKSKKNHKLVNKTSNKTVIKR